LSFKLIGRLTNYYLYINEMRRKLIVFVHFGIIERVNNLIGSLDFNLLS
jgi:hypothetical protein